MGAESHSHGGAGERSEKKGVPYQSMVCYVEMAAGRVKEGERE